jgi:hypothetical protein
MSAYNGADFTRPQRSVEFRPEYRTSLRPRRPYVIEPFAGSAGYAVYWEPPRVTLVEKDPLFVALWRWLQRVPPHEIMAIPTDIDNIDELPARFGEEARWLVGFWLVHPAKERSSWGRDEQYRTIRIPKPSHDQSCGHVVI